tara:strand:+ start:8063 stop:8320 length:258 start_codon:yes stop_codon:yes gene_type:complete
MKRADKIDKMIAEFIAEMLISEYGMNLDGIHEFPAGSEVVGEVVLEEHRGGMGSVEIAPIIYDETKMDPIVNTNELECKNDKKRR